MKFSVILCFDKNYQININKVRDAISSYRGCGRWVIWNKSFNSF